MRKMRYGLPWNRVRKFYVRQIVNQANSAWYLLKLKTSGYAPPGRNCVQRCPRGVEIIDVMRAGAPVAGAGRCGAGQYPQPAERNDQLRQCGEPWGQEPKDRANWASEQGVPEFTEGMEALYFPAAIPATTPG